MKKIFDDGVSNIVPYKGVYCLVTNDVKCDEILLKNLWFIIKILLKS